ncbi:MAG TPA: malic enzyme-like NAD(P)-binding protein [Kouleothrix sp.]|uniref:malic enzyme-like NAD(P)-binding protein n=1 Tax=Kouleothrix sp. TaxID=2779161 RepID=UPI002B6DB8BC|nr:malic enzyme-like NAD(P)-binding protein [Kouleothrix sp.]
MIAYTITLRCRIANRTGMLGRLTTAIGENGGDIGAIDIVRAERDVIVRDISVRVQNDEHGDRLVAAINQLPGVEVLQSSDRVFLAHLGGKLAIQSRVPLKTRDDLSMVYTPGVARVCQRIAEQPEAAHSLTIKRNSLAVVSDGSAVLGLGNLGAAAALPVMEGKAILFKELADIDAFPLCLAGQDADTIVATVEQIAPVFGAINLEDIAAPKCFVVEDRLRASLDIPVMHDDQHGTAVVALAALRNALRIVGKRLEAARVVVNGVGAAGTAIILNLLAAGVGEVLACDLRGILRRDDVAGLPPMQRRVAEATNRELRSGGLREALAGADVFIGVSTGNILTPELVRLMAPDSIVFALANPIPEGDPEQLRDVARIVATGRSDYPNQINNVLSFPGIFRGALDARARAITPGMRLAAAEALAAVIAPDELSEEYIIPSVFNRAIVPAIAAAVAHAATEEGVARRETI